MNEYTIRLLNEQLQTVLDACPVMIFYKDKVNRFSRVNKLLARANEMSKQKTVWVETDKIPCRDSKGKIIGFRGIKS